MKKYRYSRRDFIRTMGMASAGLALSGRSLVGKPFQRRPNILFIMTDDHAAHAISCYGSKINQTPNIDRIAREGMRFDNCFCSNAICAPSRAVILTGKYSHVNGVMDNRNTFDNTQQTYPRILQQRGYQTAVIGKWHLKTDPAGFDYWNVYPGQGDYYNPDMIEMGEKKNYTGYATDIVTDLSLNWLDQRKKDQPFCLVYQHKAPHRNWMPDAKHLHMYDDVQIPEPETLFDDYATRSDAARQTEMTIENHMHTSYDLKLDDAGDVQQYIDMMRTTMSRLNEEQRRAWDAAYGPQNKAFWEANLSGKELVRWKYQRYIKDYLRCIASVDDNVGRMLAYLDENGLTDNTIVVYTSDQGFFLGDHGWYDKRFMYEESLRMPFLVRYPKEIRPGTTNDDLVMNLDFAETFLDFAGVEVPADMQGRSLQRLMRGKTPRDWRDSIYYHYYEYPAWHMIKKHYGVRTRRYKLIHFYEDIDAWELYDLEKDPHELNNVYGNPDYASELNSLRKELERLRMKYGDTEAL